MKFFVCDHLKYFFLFYMVGSGPFLLSGSGNNKKRGSERIRIPKRWLLPTVQCTCPSLLRVYGTCYIPYCFNVWQFLQTWVLALFAILLHVWKGEPTHHTTPPDGNAQIWKY